MCFDAVFRHRNALLSALFLLLLLGGGYAPATAHDLFAWGWNGQGQFGNGSITETAAPPVPGRGVSGVDAIAAGFQFSLALKRDGTVWASGNNSYGQLGNGTFAGSINKSIAAPAPVKGLTGVVAIAAGWRHGLALKADGSVWAWGYNGNGELGCTTFQKSIATPVRVMVRVGTDEPAQYSPLTGVVAIAAGYEHSLALKADGSVWAWGYNGNGELGNGKFTGDFNDSVAYAVHVTSTETGGFLTSVSAVACGGYHNLALKSDGTVWVWGDNVLGQLGNGAFTTAAPFGIATPAQLPGLNQKS
jgi:YD repeat-containing protein